MIKSQFLDLDIKSADFKVNAETYEVAGYLAIFNTKDLGDDVLLPGAFLDLPKTLPMLWCHDMEDPIGIWTELTIDQKGLYVKGKLAKGVQQAEEALILFNIGAVKGLSIGYRTIESTYESTTGVRYLKKIKLYEGSWTPIPMHPDAMIESAKDCREQENLWEVALSELRQIAR